MPKPDIRVEYSCAIIVKEGNPALAYIEITKPSEPGVMYATFPAWLHDGRGVRAMAHFLGEAFSAELHKVLPQ